MGMEQQVPPRGSHCGMSHIALGCQDLAWIGARLTATYTKTGWGLPEALIPPLPYVTNNWASYVPGWMRNPGLEGERGEASHLSVHTVLRKQILGW